VTWMLLVPTMMLRICRLREDYRLGGDMSSLEVTVHVASPCPSGQKQY